ncbi:hypothetical protein Tsubulata_050938 [Turnera subulata]|uniref:Microtubule-associated protein 70-5 n=1 Tax=Turnera subulata TaxID=218843 RepID=A0A9Q0FX74_9ROSI|nr:hypothetical protein Tsubulata_050938 [Turnera subulata]
MVGDLRAAQGEIKALRASEVLKDKAIEELRNEVCKLDEKLSAMENLVQEKNLEIKKLTEEKRDALAAQYGAEATLRRVHANQKDDDSLPISSVIAPLEAEIKMYKNEIAALQEDKKAMERLTKSKESALLEAERILRSALERALIVEEVQNQNYELRRQIEICLEENKILEKTNRQKVLEVEKLSQTINELEEAILAGGAAANTIRDYKRQISELNEEKRVLERELARAKVCANRVATTVANEWKDENDKVMPVKQWLEERKLMQGEMQRLRDKLAISERTAKAEAQLKEKLKLRLKILEEGLKHASPGSPKPEKSNSILGFLTSNGAVRKRSASQPRASNNGRNSPMKQPNIEARNPNASGDVKRADGFRRRSGSGENLFRSGMWVSRSKFFDSTGKENNEAEANKDANVDKLKSGDKSTSPEAKGRAGADGDMQNREITIQDLQNMDSSNSSHEDVVSGFVYDRLQKEVISLRKSCEAKDSSLNVKDQEIQVDTLAKAIEVESKKVKREVVAKEKEAVSGKVIRTKRPGI